MVERILLVEDEKKLAEIIKETLELYELEVIIAHDGAEGLRLFSESKPSLIILDIMLPRMDGFQVLQQIRNTDKHVPVIMLTAKSQTFDLVKGFDLGCNDYIKKPFIIDELLVRVRSLLSRQTWELSKNKTENIIAIGNLVFNIDTQELRSPSQVFKLSHKETELLKRLWLNANKVIDRKTILFELWGDDHIFNSRNLNVYITKLRGYLKEDSRIEILNIRGLGYKLIKRSID